MIKKIKQHFCEHKFDYIKPNEPLDECGWDYTNYNLFICKKCKCAELRKIAQIENIIMNVIL